MSGRKGPVHISLPIDIQEKESMLVPEVIQESLLETREWKSDFEKTFNDSKKPIIFCGNGCFLSNATELMNEFSIKYNIPIISSIKGASACTNTNKLYLGVTGNVAKKQLIKFLKEYDADLLISLGSSLSFNSFNNYDEVFKPNIKIIRVDIEKTQFLNYKKAYLNINMDVSKFLKEISKLYLNKKNNMNLKMNEYLKNIDYCIFFENKVFDNFDYEFFEKCIHKLDSLTKNELFVIWFVVNLNEWYNCFKFSKKIDLKGWIFNGLFVS